MAIINIPSHQHKGSTCATVWVDQMSMQNPLHNPDMFMQETQIVLPQNFVRVEVTAEMMQTLMLKMTRRTVMESCKMNALDLYCTVYKLIL